MSILGKPLTPHQREIWDLREAGRSCREVAAALGISMNVVSNTIGVVRKKLGVPRGVVAPIDGRAAEGRCPELAAAAIDAAADPVAASRRAAIERVNRELEAAGVPGRVSDALVRRMLVRYGGVVTARRQITTAEILKTIDEELHLISAYIDDKVVAEAGLRDLALAKAALIEKRQLLRGEPTQIISDEGRQKLHQLLPLLLAEARRRGITIEGTAVVVKEDTSAPVAAG